MKFQVILLASAFALGNATPLESSPVQVRESHEVSRALVDRGYGNGGGNHWGHGNGNGDGNGGDYDDDECNCAGVAPGPLPSSAPYICYNYHLGPAELPKNLPLASELSSYNRLGGLTPKAFMDTWVWPNGSFRYPPPEESHGFSLDTRGNAIKGTLILEPGTFLDRFGGEDTGEYLSSADAPYSQRSLPPSNLIGNPKTGFPNNYHVYRVVRNLTVSAGPIRPWFEQPGLGTQFYTGAIGNITYLIQKNYLERVDSDVLVATRRQKSCGY